MEMEKSNKQKHCEISPKGKQYLLKLKLLPKNGLSITSTIQVYKHSQEMMQGIWKEGVI